MRADRNMETNRQRARLTYMETNHVSSGFSQKRCSRGERDWRDKKWPRQTSVTGFFKTPVCFAKLEQLACQEISALCRAGCHESIQRNLQLGISSVDGHLLHRLSVRVAVSEHLRRWADGDAGLRRATGERSWFTHISGYLTSGASDQRWRKR